MRFQCPFCNYAITIPDEYRGYRVACTSCEKSIMAPATPFEEGCVIGDFVIKSKLGEGAIGAVYKAFQISLERVVALKILSNKHITTKGLIEFQREARAAAKLIHVNLVQSYAVGEDNGICYMAMTYINGETLKSRIRRTGPIPCDEALHIIQQVAEALHYAWTESHLIHRDVKPDNIMLSENGIVKLTDLGLAMNQADWRKDMDISGSPSYMSPEQFSGEKLDTRSDIYSLGVTLYQMLTGTLPFDAETIRSIAKQHFEVAVPDIRKKVPSVPESVSRLIKKMMAKVPAKRFRDMEELLHEIWKIRQKTAPNQELVPDVHTISLRRLDYEIQLKNSEQQAQTGESALSREKPVVVEVPQSRAGLVTLCVILIFLSAGLSFALYRQIQQTKNVSPEHGTVGTESAEIYEYLSHFETLAADPSLSHSELEENASSIITKLNADREIHEAVRNAINAYVISLLSKQTEALERQRERDLIAEQKIRINELSFEVSRLEDEIRSKTALSEGQQKKYEEQALQLAELDLLKKEYEKIRATLSQEQRRAAHGTEHILADLDKQYLNFLLKLDFDGCNAWLSAIREKHPELAEVFDAFEKYNAILQKTAQRMNGKNSDCSRMALSIGTVSHYDTGLVYCFTKAANNSDSINLAKIPWFELPPDDLWMLVTFEKKAFRSDSEPAALPSELVFPDTVRSLVKAVYALLNGMCSEIYTTVATSNQLSETDGRILSKLADHRSAAMAETLYVLCENGKIPAKVLFAHYQKYCQNAPGYAENVKKLAPYFEKKDTGKTVDKSSNL